MTFKYRNIKAYLYLEGGETSVWGICVACWYSSKDLHKNIHHLVPLLCEGFLEKIFEGILCPIIFLFSCHERSLGRARYFFLKRNKVETQFFVPWPHWGHALRRQAGNHFDTIDLDFMSIKKWIQIIKIFLTRNNKDRVKLVFYSIRK